MLNKNTFNYVQETEECLIETELAPVEEFETIDIENLPQNTIVQWPKKPLPKNQAIVTKPCSVVLHKLKLIRIPDDGSSPGKIMERRLPKANETNKVGITCGKLTYRAE